MTFLHLCCYWFLLHHAVCLVFQSLKTGLRMGLLVSKMDVRDLWSMFVC